MKILVLGQGAREHAIVKALVRTGTERADIVCAPGNAGIGADVAVDSTLDQLNPAAVATFAAAGGFELVIVGPEAPLIAGVADAVREVAATPIAENTSTAATIAASTEHIGRRGHLRAVPNK